MLGISWSNLQDTSKFNTPSITGKEPLKLSKRRLLSLVAQIYDPVGFSSVSLIRAKIGLQDLWQKEIDWGEELSRTECDQWTASFQQIEQLNDVAFQRCISVLKLPNIVVSADASHEAF